MKSSQIQNNQPLKTYDEVVDWITQRKVQDIEIMVSDFAGISRGKKKPVKKFISSLGSKSLRIPSSIFGTTVDCEFVLNEHLTAQEVDVFVKPDFATAGIVPWAKRPTAFFICDVETAEGKPFPLSPRQILKGVVDLYLEQGWKPIVAPEYEFILLEKSDQSQPQIPNGRSGLSLKPRGVMSLDGLSEFGPLFDDVHKYCAKMGMPMDSLVQEAGASQFEFNIIHGDPVQLADHTFHFKRIMKWAAIKHGYYACFMAKPFPKDFGNAMHIHQSVVDVKTGRNVFADDEGKNTNLFLSHVAGLQKYMLPAMPFLAPYENSYLRLASALSSPTNTHWGEENRTVGLRVPEGGGSSRRIENRIAGSDVNPYLAIAASLACGYLGMMEGLTPTDPVTEPAYDMPGNRLSARIHSGIRALEKSDALRRVLGDAFVTTYIDVKRKELQSRSQVLSSWDIEYLLMNV